MLALNVSEQRTNLPVHQLVPVRNSLSVNITLIAVVKVIGQLFQQSDLFAFLHLVKQFGLLLYTLLGKMCWHCA